MLQKLARADRGAPQFEQNFPALVAAAGETTRPAWAATGGEVDGGAVLGAVRFILLIARAIAATAIRPMPA